MAEQSRASLIDRTLSQLRSAWNDIASSMRSGAVRPGLPDDDLERLHRNMLECLDGRGGEVSARARAADLGRVYLTLDADGRGRFLGMLARDFATDGAAVNTTIDAYRASEGDEARRNAEAALRRALVPPRLRLLTQFNALPEGVKFLVDLRADLLQIRNEGPHLAGLEADLKQLLTSWFDIGFLDLRRITWDAPATLLEKLIAYEAVHEIRSWSDLKNRLDSDRRCFAFFHPRMPNEPLIFVEVALVNGIAGNVQALLDESAPERDPNAADTAIFYSISNAQIGLAGISFGGFLIKRVADALAGEFNGLRTFATLSPIPGFRRWLDPLLAAGDESLISRAEAKALAGHTGAGDGHAAMRALLDSPWHEDEAAAGLLKRPLARLCARYILHEKRGGRPLDRVARFHLINGARVERVNWLADTSPRGLGIAAGMMVNYVYKLDEIEENHEAYTAEGRVAASSAVRALLRGQPQSATAD